MPQFCAKSRDPHGVIWCSMEDQSHHTPLWFRGEAARCFRLADQAWDDKTHDALIEYGRELLDRAEQMERALDRTGIAETRTPHVSNPDTSG